MKAAVAEPPLLAPVASFLFGFAAAFLVEGALVATAADVRARAARARLAATLRRLRPFVVRLAVVSTVYSVVVSLGFVLLVVPVSS